MTTTEYTVHDTRNGAKIYCGDAENESDAIRQSGINDARFAEIATRDSSRDQPYVGDSDLRMRNG
jgi:hypothetical protein